MMKSRARGFTLLETLVVLVITSLISVVLVQGFGLILAARTSVQTKLVDVDQAVLKRNLFLEPLRGVLPDYPQHPHLFVGEARKITGLTVRPLEERLGAPVGFTLTMDYDSAANLTSLVYQEEASPPQVLVSWEGNTGAFAYRDLTGDWKDSWSSEDGTTTQTPWLIRVSMGNDFPSTVIAAVSGAHQRRLRMQDSPFPDSAQ